MLTSAPRPALAPLDPGPMQDGDLQLTLEKFAPHAVHGVPAHHFRMVNAGSRDETGHINLRLGWDENLLQYAGHLGYGVQESHRGQRLAARAVALLTPLARSHGYSEIWITCDPENVASRRTCELAGAEFIETVDVPMSSVYYERGIRQKCRYRLSLT